MRIYTKVVMDMTKPDMPIIESEWFEYSGQVAELKGDSFAKSITQQQLDLQKQSFALEKQQIDFINKGFSGYLKGDVGFDPKQLALLKSNFLNSTSSDFNSAYGNLRSTLKSMGEGQGDLPISGPGVGQVANLEGIRAASQAGGLRDIDLANLQQMLSNKFNAGSLMAGLTPNFTSNVGQFGSGASSALNAYIQSKNQGFGAAFTSAFGSTLGKGLGTAITGGIGGGLGKIGVPGMQNFGG